FLALSLSAWQSLRVESKLPVVSTMDRSTFPVADLNRFVPFFDFTEIPRAAGGGRPPRPFADPLVEIFSVPLCLCGSSLRPAGASRRGWGRRLPRPDPVAGMVGSARGVR